MVLLDHANFVMLDAGVCYIKQLDASVETEDACQGLVAPAHGT